MGNIPKYTVTHHGTPSQADLDHIFYGHNQAHSHDQETGKPVFKPTTIYDKPLIISGDTRLKDKKNPPKASTENYFNAFCSVVDVILSSNSKNKDARIQEILTILRKATGQTKVFNFDMDDRFDIEEETFEELTKTRLPFPIVSIAYHNGIVSIIETEKEVICVTFYVYDNLDWMIQIGNHDQIDIKYTKGIDHIEAKGELKEFKMIAPTKKQTVIREYDPSDFPTDDTFAEYLESYSEMVSQAYLTIGSIALPSKFIFETRPSNPPKKKKGKTPRLSERPTYTMLEPGKIRKILKSESEVVQSDRSSPIPHDRRGHWRTLRSEIFKNKQGQQVWINPVWIGCSEAQVGNKIYKVRLDL